jgi:hypothetical protein
MTKQEGEHCLKQRQEEKKLFEAEGDNHATWIDRPINRVMDVDQVDGSNAETKDKLAVQDRDAIWTGTHCSGQRIDLSCIRGTWPLSVRKWRGSTDSYRSESAGRLHLECTLNLNAMNWRQKSHFTKIRRNKWRFTILRICLFHFFRHNNGRKYSICVISQRYFIVGIEFTESNQELGVNGGFFLRTPGVVFLEKGAFPFSRSSHI